MSDISEFWKALSEYVPPPKPDIEHRLYYDGDRLLYKIIESRDVVNTGNYIVITREQYLIYRPGYHRIEDGKLLTITPMDSHTLQLEKVEDGDYCTVKDNMVFLAEDGDRYSKRIRYT